MKNILDIANFNGWLPCEDVLPDKNKMVICAIYSTDLIIAEDGESIEDAIIRTMREAAKHPRVELGYIGSDGWYDYEGYPMVCTPRYWMPIPKPPVVEGGKKEVVDVCRAPQRQKPGESWADCDEKRCPFFAAAGRLPRSGNNIRKDFGRGFHREGADAE